MIDFSVVIPTYRRNKELAEALASVLRQGGVTFEVLVIDDCPDGSAKDVVDALKDFAGNIPKKSASYGRGA